MLIDEEPCACRKRDSSKALFHGVTRMKYEGAVSPMVICKTLMSLCIALLVDQTMKTAKAYCFDKIGTKHHAGMTDVRKTVAADTIGSCCRCKIWRPQLLKATWFLHYAFSTIDMQLVWKNRHPSYPPG